MVSYMRPYVLTITLNPTIDKTINVSNFKIGKEFREDNHYSCVGGKGINVSRVLVALGVRTIASGFVGDDYRAFVHKELTREKIEYDFSPVNGDIRVSLTIIDSITGKVTRLLEQGPSVELDEINKFRRKFKQLLKNCRYVVLSGRSIPGVSDKFYGELIALAHDSHKLTILDTSGEAFSKSIKKKPYMIKPNIEEAEEFFGAKLTSLSSIKKAAIAFYKMGIQVVAISMAAKGAIVYNGEEMLTVVPPKIDMKSPVGCGDSFVAGFIAGQLMNHTFSECSRLAVACGTANTMTVTSGGIKKNILNDIIPQITLVR